MSLRRMPPWCSAGSALPPAPPHQWRPGARYSSYRACRRRWPDRQIREKRLERLPRCRGSARADSCARGVQTTRCLDSLDNLRDLRREGTPWRMVDSVNAEVARISGRHLGGRALHQIPGCSRDGTDAAARGRLRIPVERPPIAPFGTTSTTAADCTVRDTSRESFREPHSFLFP